MTAETTSDTVALETITNEELAESLEEVARLLDAQGANPYRVRAYRKAAETVRGLSEPALEVLRRGGGDAGALTRLPGIGDNLARSIRQLLLTGRLGFLERLRGETPPAALLSTVPGLGPELVRRIREQLGIETLEELELAAHDGRLARLPGFGPRRVQAVVEELAGRLGRQSRVRRRPAPEPPVAEILEIDAEYRRKVAEGTLPRFAPRRFNPEGRAWLPILHADRPSGHYTALFSNTAHAHARGRTRDWVVIYFDDGQGEHQATVVTETRGRLAGLRVVRGREPECGCYYRAFRGSAGAGERWSLGVSRGHDEMDFNARIKEVKDDSVPRPGFQICQSAGDVRIDRRCRYPQPRPLQVQRSQLLELPVLLPVLPPAR